MRSINRNLSRITKNALLALIVCCAIVSHALAEQSETEKQICENKNIDKTSDQCTELLKRSRLKSKKLIPEIRTETIDQESEFNINALYPFIQGAGVIN